MQVADVNWKQRKLDVLAQVCRRHEIRRILDLGCGDLQVVRDLLNQGQFDYVGVDFREQILGTNQIRFPDLKFITVDLNDIQRLTLERPDLVICFDVLCHIQDDETYDHVCDFMFNCGAKAVALTCAVGDQGSDGINSWYRDFWEHADRLQFRYIHKNERPFRLLFERIISFDLCEPSACVESTEVVYVCSPDREQQLFVSLGMLLTSGTSFDRVVIFCVGRRPQNWRFVDSRIVVKEVSPLFNDYFYGNKIYLCERLAPRVVFLDTDTLILRPLDILWQGRDVDFLARVGTAYEDHDWKRELWQETLRRVGPSEVPMFNAGVLIFQNSAHRRIQAAWLNFVTRYLTGELAPPFPDTRMPEQWGLALAVGSVKLRYSLLQPTDHTYGWIGEPYSDAVVFHTGNPLFEKYAFKMGVAAAPLTLLASRHENGARVHALLQKSVTALTDRVCDLEQELASLKTSTTFSVGNLLVSILRVALALCRFDFQTIRQQWRVIRHSLGHVLTKRVPDPNRPRDN
jgi:hypothetical protein